MSQVKEQGRCAFAPEHGGSYQVWKQRPLSQELLKYTAYDVSYLHNLRQAYDYGYYADTEERYERDEREMTTIADKRMTKAIEDASAAKGKHMARRDF
jgi:ribonuclease D|eukprot:4307133-Prymnesium_polylepis.1